MMIQGYGAGAGVTAAKRSCGYYEYSERLIYWTVDDDRIDGCCALLQLVVVVNCPIISN